MLISEFARATGLTQDTIRFYVRRGLLQPSTTDKGGRNPYQIFAADDVKAARLIRLAQSLGMSLREIGDISREARAGEITHARSLEIMTVQLGLLTEKAKEQEMMTGYLKAKIAWLTEGGKGDEPDFPGVGAR